MGVEDDQLSDVNVQTEILAKSDENWSIEEHIKLLKGEIDNNNKNLDDGKSLDLPPWFDLKKFQRGQQFFHDNLFALFVSKLAGLCVVLTVPEINKILIMTNQSSEPKTAFKRYLATIAHMKLWYSGEIYDQQSWAYKSLRDVHRMHTAANKRGLREGKGALSQLSLAITQFGFMGYSLLAPEKLGVHIANDIELEGFIHFWRTIGYMVGVQDKYNICRDSIAETKAICQAIVDIFFNPVLKEPTEEFSKLSAALLHGVWAIVPQIDFEAFSAFTKYLSGLEVEPCSNWYSRSMYNFQVFVHSKLLGSKWFGKIWRGYFNFHLWLTIVLTIKWPLLAYYAFNLPLKPFRIF